MSPKEAAEVDRERITVEVSLYCVVRPRSMASKTWIESQTPSALPPGVAAVALSALFHVVSSWPGPAGQRRTLLEQNNAGKSIVQVPEVDTAHTALVVEIPVDVKRLVGLDLHLADTLARDSTLASTLAATGTDTTDAALIQRRVELVAPWRAVAVAVTVVVAKKVVAARLLAPLDGQGLIYG